MEGYGRTFLLLAMLTALFGATGFLLAGEGGALVALAAAAAVNLFAWWGSASVVLRMHHAQPIGPQEAPRLYAITEQLARRAGMPTPRLYIIHEDQPNAFATGRGPSDGVVAVNSGLLDLMPEREVAAVIAHEIAHIKHRDTLVMSIAATLSGAIGMLAQFGGLFAHGRDHRNPLGFIGTLLLLVLGPIAAVLVQMAISRAREFEADREGAELVGDPRWLASALQRLEGWKHSTLNETAELNPATAHMFIINPLRGADLRSLFSTHPPTEQRVARLLRMQPRLGGGLPALPARDQPPGGSPWAKPRPASPWDLPGSRNPWA
ncbi:MAG: M48 family metalloprotease [Rhodovarius sp.]|nr:M48 family metalloprotease [Rhodovarius sp.]